jgi:hypothetical protein
MIIKVELDAQEWQAVVNHLARAPYSEVAGVIAKIIQQVQNSQFAVPQPPAMPARPDGQSAPS